MRVQIWKKLRKKKLWYYDVETMTKFVTQDTR